MDTARQSIRTAEVLLPCAELEATLAFFTERLGFRIETITPAEDPAAAVIAGHGLRVRLVRGAAGDPGALRLECDDPRAVGGGALELRAPNGTRVELVGAAPPLVVPPLRPSLVLSRLDEATWLTGRAGMLYRDLVPDRQGGRFVASHIRIEEGGPVPDWVHFHRVRFQLIWCWRGEVRLVYEDQGPPFVLRAGDCVLQPPEIRHRVLECSPGLEVIEVTCPAAHDTCADHELALPSARARPERTFAGQRFVRHEAAGARWRPWRLAGFECRDTGIAAATAGLVGARVVRFASAAPARESSHDAELLFSFVSQGTVDLVQHGRRTERLAAGDALVVPAGSSCTLAAASQDLELLEVSSPASV